ncbi:hypothetical protein [Natronosalvus halobius]|uniref:hypothetical protein n=1 Tax=Natronosalvus halobius TaxID=2953746 RepID=UPI00209E2870|nr:hypothetical protein [Natronosalvus halobius]USZ70521.1 hypothetical protein NGM15_10395 [Natronosalvus halobius]
MEPLDEDILHYLKETDAELTPSAIARNLDPHSYGEIRFRIADLERQGFIEKTHEEWGYYGISKTGREYLDGRLNESLSSDHDLPDDDDAVGDGTIDSQTTGTTSDYRRILLTDIQQEYERQLDSYKTLDNTALRGVRTGFVVIGVLVTGFSIADLPDPAEIHWGIPTLIISAIMLFLSAILLGWIVVNITDFEHGVGPVHRDSVLDDPSEPIEETIDRYDSLGSQLDAEIERNTNVLSLMHVSIFIGVCVLIIASGLYVFTTIYEWQLLHAGLASILPPILAFVGAVLLYRMAANSTIDNGTR